MTTVDLVRSSTYLALLLVSGSSCREPRVDAKTDATVATSRRDARAHRRAARDARGDRRAAGDLARAAASVPPDLEVGVPAPGYTVSEKGTLTVAGKLVAYFVQSKPEPSSYEDTITVLRWRARSRVRRQRIMKEMCWYGCGVTLSVSGDDELVVKYSVQERHEAAETVMTTWQWGGDGFTEGETTRFDPLEKKRDRVFELLKQGKLKEAGRFLDDNNDIYDPTGGWDNEAATKWFSELLESAHKHAMRAASAGQRRRGADLVRWLFFTYLRQPYSEQGEEGHPEPTTIMICKAPVETGEARCKKDTPVLYVNNELQRLYDCAALLAHDGDWRAEHLLRQLAQQQPDDARVQLDLADLLWARKKLREAGERYRAYRDLMRKKGAEKSMAGHVHQRIAPARALRALGGGGAIQAAPAPETPKSRPASLSPEVLELLKAARGAIGRRQLDKGIAKLQEAKKLRQSSLICGELGWALFRVNKLDEADRELRAALGLSTAAAEKGAILYNLGRVAEARGKTSEAIERYEASLRVRPNKAVKSRLEALRKQGAVREEQ